MEEYTELLVELIIIQNGAQTLPITSMLTSRDDQLQLLTTSIPSPIKSTSTVIIICGQLRSTNF